MTKTKKVKSSGRFGARAGSSIRKRLNAVEVFQKQKQTCPFCARPGLKREAAGIWQCFKCGKKFAGHAYFVNSKN